MLSRLLPLVLLCCAFPPLTPSRADDLKLVIQSQVTPNGHPIVFTEYLKGQRSRTELRSTAGWGVPGGGTIYANGHTIATIYQCDKRRVYRLDLEAHEYTTYELDERGLPVGSKTHPVEPSGATVSVTIESSDTGERKQVFGHLARRIVTKRKIVPGPGACTHSEEIEEDGWYIDLDATVGCPHLPRRDAKGAILSGSSGCNGKMDKFEVHRSGVAETGFPLKLTTTTQSQVVLPDGSSKPVNTTLARDVVEFSEAPLDPALLEVPADFKRWRNSGSSLLNRFRCASVYNGNGSRTS